MAKTLLIAIHLKDTLNLVHFQFASSILGYVFQQFDKNAFLLQRQSTSCKLSHTQIPFKAQTKDHACSALIRST